MSEFADIMEQLKAGAERPIEAQLDKERRRSRPKAFTALEQKPARPLSRQRLCIDLPADVVKSFRDICHDRGLTQRDALEAALKVFVEHFRG